VDLPGSKKTRVLAECAWNGEPQKVKALSAKGAGLPGCATQVPRGTWNPVGIREDHLLRLSTASDR
jgi:hypothetical protein